MVLLDSGVVFSAEESDFFFSLSFEGFFEASVEVSVEVLVEGFFFEFDP